MDSLSGEMRVVGGSRTRRGVRRQDRRASCNSKEETAGSGAATEATAGGSAHTSAARAAGREADADLANLKAETAGGTPRKTGTSKEKTADGGKKPERRVPGFPAKNAGPAHHAGQPGATRIRKGGGDDNHREEAIESLWEERACLDGGEPLPEDGAAFVDAVNDHVGLVRTTELLLRGRDEKSSKSLLELLLEMKYGEETRAFREQAKCGGVPATGN